MLKVLVVVTVALLTSVFAACGSPDAAGSGTTSSTTEASTSASSTAGSSSAFEVHRVAYDTDDADPDQNWADLYLPAGQHRAGSLPLVFLVHGGAWEAQLGAQTMAPMARDLVERGLAVYNIEYRRLHSGGGWPITWDDVLAAIYELPDLKKKYPQLNLLQAVAVGHSAGAELAMLVGAERNNIPDYAVSEGYRQPVVPLRVVSIAGPLDLLYAAEHGDRNIIAAMGGVSPYDDPGLYQRVSPIERLDPEVPVIAIHGLDDKVVSPVNSERYVAALNKAGGSAKLVEVEGENHVSIVDSTRPFYPRIIDYIYEMATERQAELLAKYRNGGTG